jgi:Zn-dependent protease with chaperone function
MSTLLTDVTTPFSGSAADADAATTSDPQRDQKILTAVEIDVQKTKVPAAYGLAMGALATCLVLLPLAYVALLAFLGWLLIWHSFQTFASFEYGPYFVFHVPMACLAALLLLFLVKPIFFRLRMKDDGVMTLTRESEPLLFAFVERLCGATKAPRPAEIEVDCEPNAGARLRRGIGGLFSRKRELVLRIGLPLAAGLSVRQFAGVLGHELGHFNQPRGMTGSYLIRRLTAFFARIVFQRDRLDERLARMKHNRNAFAQLSFYIAVAFIEPARGVLWLMLLAGELLTCGVLRRMEYDADHVEAHVSGVEDFVRVNQMLLFLQIATQRAHHDTADALQQQRLADDLPRLILANARQLAEHRDDILKLLDCGKTRWFDTHPCHADRVRNVERTGAAGLVECDLGARHLFARFDDVCRRATSSFYKAVLGRLAASDAKLVPTAQLVEERTGQRKSAKSLQRFFRGHVVAPRPVFPAQDANEAADDVSDTTRELAASRAEMLAVADSAGPLVQQYLEAADTMPLAQAQLALTALFPDNPKVPPIRQRAKSAVMKYQPVLIQSAQGLARFEKPARTRLTLALRLAHRSDIALVAPGDADSRPLIAKLLPVCARLETALPTTLRLRELAGSLEIFMSAYNESEPQRQLAGKVLQTIEEITQALDELKLVVMGTPYPFEHGTKDATIDTALIERRPDSKDPVDAHACATATVDRYFTLTFRCLAALTEIAERVETAVGLEPLEEPKQDERAEEEQEKIQRTGEARDSRRYWLGYGIRATAGLVLVAGLIGMSLSPPELPTMPWESPSAGANRPRPSAFYASVPITHYTTYAPAPPSAYMPRGPGAIPGTPRPGGPWTPGQPPPGGNNPYNGVPQQPGFPASPQHPGYPGRSAPGYQQPGNPRPGYPQPGGGGYQPPRPGGYNPRPYTPPSPGGGGYGGNRGGGGGGGYSPPGPGGGGGGRR